MVGPVEDENFSRLKSLLNEIHGDLGGSCASAVSLATRTHRGFTPSSLMGTEEFSLPFNRIRRLAESRILPVDRWFLSR